MDYRQKKKGIKTCIRLIHDELTVHIWDRHQQASVILNRLYVYIPYQPKFLVPTEGSKYANQMGQSE